MKELLWPLARCGEAIDAVSRATRWIGPVARELPRYDGSAAEPWVAACATFLRVDAEPVVKGQTAASSYKPAMLENGVRVMVPPFVGVGERVVVDTNELTYVRRAD